MLARSALPSDPSSVVTLQLARLRWPFWEYRPIETLRALFEAGVRWHTGSTEEIGEARRDLLQTDDWDSVKLLKLLATDDYCSEEVLTELARTSSIRNRMKKVGLIPPTSRERSDFDRRHPGRAREILARFGVEVPKPKKTPVHLPPTVRIGAWHPGGRELRLDRPALFDRVWTVPVDSLAKEWGMSGRGLAKACRRLRIPVPPRGYWAKVAAGHRVRRPKLPALPPGQGEEIVIRLPAA